MQNLIVADIAGLGKLIALMNTANGTTEHFTALDVTAREPGRKPETMRLIIHPAQWQKVIPRRQQLLQHALIPPEFQGGKH